MVTCGARREVTTDKTVDCSIGNMGISTGNGNDVACNEMDTMADTSCAGVNWTLMETTGMECKVSDFMGQQVGGQYVPIATCATCIREKSTGVEYILIGHQMLWFGSALKKTLLNQNQIRYCGHVVRDDPTRKEDEGFGITADGLYIPFEIQGTTIYFESRAPTKHEIETLPAVTLTRQELWDPKSVDLSLHNRSPLDDAREEISLEIGAVSSACDPVAVGQRLDSLRSVGGLGSDRHSTVSPENLSKKWKIGLETARKTLRVTTQQGIRTAVTPITRRYRVDNLALHRNRLNSRFYTDTLFARTTSLSGHKCAQVFTDGQYTAVYPLASKAHVGQALARFIDEVGVPDGLTADLAGEQTGAATQFTKLSRFHRIDLKWAEKGTSKQNHRAEREIGLLKQRWHRRMVDCRVPRRLWDYGLVHESGVLSRVARGHDSRSGIERLTGETPNISEWIDFQFFDIVWYHDNTKADTSDEHRHLGFWLGIAHRIGSDLCYWILTKAGKVLARTTVQHVTEQEQAEPAITAKIQEFRLIVEQRLDDTNFVDWESKGPGFLEDVEEPVEDDTQVKGVIPTDEEYGKMIQEPKPEADDLGEEYDNYLGAQIQLDVGGETLLGTVVKRKKGLDGKPIGTRHKNPLFDSRAYDVSFPGGVIQEYTANVIAESLYSQLDDQGRQFAIMSEIIGHRKNGDAVGKDDGFIVSKNGNKVPRRTTKGWEIAIEWKDGSQSWIPLREAKDGYPIELAEYIVAQGLEQEPAFHWWVPRVMNHKRRIINKVVGKKKKQKKYWKLTHKYGVRLPHSVEEALQFDKETGTTFWRDAIAKELGVVKVAWEARDDLVLAEVRAGRQLIGYTEIKCHMVFDVKMDLTRKARLVAGGHMTDAPSSLTYSSVVSRDSIRIAFLIAALNDLDVLACDIGNAYLNAPCREKIWFLGGAEVGSEFQGKVCVMTRALYGLKSSGASWRATLVSTLYDMGYVDTKADPCVLRRERKRDNGEPYYELILVYVDDILLVSHKPEPVFEEIDRHYKIKKGSIGPPTTYLGAQVYQHNLPTGGTAWGMSSEKYVNNAIKVVEQLLLEDGDGKHLKTTARVPIETSYKPELDTSEELDDKMRARYQQLIGVLRWAVEIGRVDIYLEVSIMSQYLANPRKGHLEAVYCVFSFLKSHPKLKMVFDPVTVKLDESCFAQTPIEEWKEFYGDVAEEVPADMPTPLGNPVEITCFVDADHAGNVVTRRSHTGILVFLQNAPILWFSKRQNTVETSSFGSEFVAMRIAKELIVGMRYKLRMFGVPVVGPANILCDNRGVVKNTSIPSSILSKRHNAINYHSVREAAAAGIVRVGKEDTETNIADLFTKMLPQSRRNNLISQFTYSSAFGDRGPPSQPRGTTK